MNMINQIRADTPQVGVPKFHQVHAHSTGNGSSTAKNEAEYMNRKDLHTGYFTHVVGNGQVIQTALVNRGAYDVGGGWNYETYAAVELIESHKTRAEFERDYRLYVELLRSLADQAGVPKTLDTSDISGIKTHMYCTYNQPNNESDHIDPYPYLNKWGITVNRFEKDLANGFSSSNNLDTTNNQNKGRVATMYAIYWVNGTGYYFNGVSYSTIKDFDSVKILRQVYKDNNGKDIPEYKWDNKAPWHVRLQQPTVNLQDMATKIDRIAKKTGA